MSNHDLIDGPPEGVAGVAREETISAPPGPPPSLTLVAGRWSPPLPTPASNPPRARGSRETSRGHPHAPTIPRHRILARLRRDEDCWRWDGSHDRDGYGRAGRGGLAHRLVYALMVGPIPAGLELDHLCGVRDCCAPAHLEPVTHRTNLLRSQNHVAQRARATHCPRGHAYNSVNTRRDRYGKRYCRTCDRIPRPRPIRHLRSLP